ncbi:hypothetical protein PENTCL1PPCAC_27507, partial [Pristionchus entomophagus]
MSTHDEDEEQRLLDMHDNPIDIEQQIDEDELMGDNAESSQPDASEAAMLEAANHPGAAPSLATDDREQLVRPIEELEASLVTSERRLAEIADERDKFERECNQSNAELRRLQKGYDEKDMKAAAAEMRRSTAQAALFHAFKGDDTRRARQWRTELLADEPARVPLDAGSVLHPDHQCEDCGQRAAADLFKEPRMKETLKGAQ